jgi:hypothetical protein
MRKFMRLLMASTALAMIAGVAGAANFIAIDVGPNGDSGNPGKVTALAITQDNVSATNAVSGGGTIANPTGTFAVNGPWRTITIGQTSGAAAGNILSGSITSVSGTANDFIANYTTNATAAGNNVHSLALNAGGTAVANIGVTNTGTNTLSPDNTITDKLTATGAVSYTLTLDGSGNNVTNTIGQAGGAVGSIGLTVGATGDNNTITNTSTGSGAKTIGVSLASNGNTVSNNLSGAGDQTSNLTADAGSTVNYQLASTGASSIANVTLNGVVGLAGGQAAVNVSQGGTLGTGSTDTATLIVNGNGMTMGTLTGGAPTGTSLQTAGVQVVQASIGATLNATVTAAANGYTASFHQ